MSDTDTNTVCEVVAVFHEADKLDAAAKALETAGFSQSRMSVIADRESVAKKLDHHYEPVNEMEDDPRVPQSAFVYKSDRAAAESIAFGLPLYVGAMGGALMVVASGGAVAMALLAAAAGGVVGGGLGGALAGAIGQTHADRMEASLQEGGILFWVVVTNDIEERQVAEILTQAGGADVHAHRIERTWGDEESIFKNWNPDPFLD